MIVESRHKVNYLCCCSTFNVIAPPYMLIAIKQNSCGNKMSRIIYHLCKILIQNFDLRMLTKYLLYVYMVKQAVKQMTVVSIVLDVLETCELAVIYCK